MSLIREYETTFILRPDIQQADKARITERVKSIIEEQFSGEVRRIEEWGKRQLAYLMQKQSFGIYVYVRYAARPDAIAEIERILRLNDHGQDSGKRPDQSDVSYDDVDDMDEEE